MAKKILHLLSALLLINMKCVSAAVILQYHHVSEKLPAVTSLSAEQFRAHLNYLKESQFKVLPLDELLESLRKGDTLPTKAVAITFDDGYDNNIEQAAPILEEFNFPYTIFVNPKLIDEQQSYVMTWSQLRQLASQGALIANHSAKHDYLHKRLQGENLEQWKVRISHDISWSEQRIKEEVGHNAKLLAYPYGEFNHDLKELVTSLGFIGIGQHSGAVGVDSDFTRLPRFPASGVYSDLNTLKVKLNSKPFAIADLNYADSVTDNQQPTLVINFKEVNFNPKQFTCYISGQGKGNVEWLDDKQVSVEAVKALPKGRSRYNCTAPAAGESGQFFWFSQPWVIN
ncbi:MULTISPECIES: polysaccharide deacetylase family protein [Pseudoalteromonas]|uniref:Polysaccharide deacetylase n=1 Tax=Pseudoalteromonas amylolytica TaxID=1859457 RepID=A0A1S1MSB2_9GAMM|nr:MULTISPECIES: polysaccharide deacetylase family protein [Pseudoalteromonas]OHU86354.1 polysaccharide deacetylase [Pseudoalteromonas sp. JW3]OHU89541.1 polysaccharide deacetylase [Pseudoalteromonas amylolytica]